MESLQNSIIRSFQISRISDIKSISYPFPWTKCNLKYQEGKILQRWYLFILASIPSSGEKKKKKSYGAIKRNIQSVVGCWTTKKVPFGNITGTKKSISPLFILGRIIQYAIFLFFKRISGYIYILRRTKNFWPKVNFPPPPNYH